MCGVNPKSSDVVLTVISLQIIAAKRGKLQQIKTYLGKRNDRIDEI